LFQQKKTNFPAPPQNVAATPSISAGVVMAAVSLKSLLFIYFSFFQATKNTRSSILYFY
jgi:hypothetical protein